MALETVNAADPNSAVLLELQGLRLAVVDGAAAGTKMNIAAMRPEDTVLSATILADTWAAPTDDTANVTIQSGKATGTFTVSSTGPLNNETFTVNDVVYTFKTAGTGTAATHVALNASTSITLDNMVAAVNAYENRRTGGGWNVPSVVASKTSSTVVTITAADEGAGNGAVVTENTTGTTIVVSSTAPAAVTATFATAVANNSLTVNGIAFVLKATSTSDTEVVVGANNTATALAMANAINYYENTRGTLDVTASAALAVVTIAPKSYKKGNLVTISDTGTNLASSGSGYLSGGTATGGIKSTTNLATATLLVLWYDKNR